MSDDRFIASWNDSLEGELDDANIVEPPRKNRS